MKSKLVILAAIATVYVTACAPAAKAPAQVTAAAKNKIRDVLLAQSDCWSRSDLECYMQGYWKSDSLLFVGSRGLTYGWQQTLDNYKRSYPDASAMGMLTFDVKEMRELSPETMLVVGKWHLQREAAKGNLEGHFFVVFKHFTDGWKIVADHSS
ncbi:YybH family protein [Pontibacter sp. H249]|uniref:YybH family protein n=1 Tax=Pontibacter sp. H249 TaxID=3133420 RepID=UPI0030C302EF